MIYFLGLQFSYNCVFFFDIYPLLGYFWDIIWSFFLGGAPPCSYGIFLPASRMVLGFSGSQGETDLANEAKPTYVTTKQLR